MWHCPICSNEENNINICQKCGYDRSKDFVCNRTISQVPKKDANEFVKLIAAHDEEENAKAAAAVKELLDAIKREMQKKEEEERRARIAEETRRAEEARCAEEARRAEAARRAEEAERQKKAEELAALKEHEAQLAAQKRREADEYSKAQEKKKRKKIFRVLAGGIILGMMATTGFMLSQKSEDPDEGSPIWYSIKQESIKALEGGSIDYTTISIDSMCEAWTSYGYEVFAPEVYTYDTEEGTETELRTSAKLQVGETSYYWISYSEPMEGNATEENMRRVEFECYMEDSDTIADANAKAVGDEMVPLPMGIQFGDSFETVSNKLGVSAAGIERGTYTLYESEYVYVDYADPKHESDSTSRSIYLGGDGSSFFYIFDDNELTNYWVSLDIDYLARVQDVYVPDETESALNSQEKMDVWYAIHQESVEALDIVTINFETDSLEEIKEHYTTMGYSVSDNEFTTDGEDGDIVTYRGMDAYILAENADYFVSGHNVYKEGSSGWHERTFRFGSNAYDPEYAADEAWRGWHALQSPLPMDIQFDDSFETVSEKLGLTEANIEPGQYSSDVNGHLYVVYTAPEEGMEAYTYIGTDSYSFNYWFNSEGTLYDYEVNIIH